jgi:hypothetical protein
VTIGMLRTLPAMAFAGTLPTLGLIFASGAQNFLASPHPTTISGRLTYNGAPLADSTVVLVPAGQPKTRLAALGEVAPDGSFTLHPATMGRSLEPGRYDRYISLFEALPAAAEPASPEAGDTGLGGQATGSPAPLRRGRIPTRFTAPETSGLSVAISPGPCRVDRIDIALRD